MYVGIYLKRATGLTKCVGQWQDSAQAPDQLTELKVTTDIF